MTFAQTAVGSTLRAAPWTGIKRFAPIAALGCCVAGAAATTAGSDEGQVLCVYRLTTGGWCPGCGCTRALGAIGRGDFSAAFSLNPWMILLFIQAAAITTMIAWKPERALNWWSQYGDHVMFSSLAIGIAVWSVRLGVGDIPSPF